MRRNRIAKVLAWLSLVTALAVSILLFFVPLYEGVTIDPTTHQQVATSTATLLEINGVRVLIPLAIPPLLTAAVLLAVLRAWRVRKLIIWVAAGLLAVFVALTGFSIGVFYLPSPVFLVASAVVVPGTAGK